MLHGNSIITVTLPIITVTR